MSSPIRVPADELRRLSRQALEKFGLGAEDAKVAADVLVEADLLGIETHGTKRLRAYVERILRGGVNTTPAITVIEKTSTVAIVDGDGALGPVVGARALNEAMTRAKQGGISYVGCRNSNHFGAMAPYGLWACRAELISIMGTNASTAMAPWGARELRM
ncbi:MAG: Ldh family oxidoreductase, partial [Proteobacteria bacterium]|nr:Ldh family oxidoreductase [Pseudomonadota bacterium]